MRRFTFVAALAATFGLSDTGFSQSGLFGSSGPVGQGGMNTTPTAGGSSAFGRSSTNTTTGALGGTTAGGLTGNMSSGVGGNLSSGGGQGGLGGSGLGGTAGTQTSALNLEFGSASNTIGQNQFIGRNSTNGLVGNTMAGQQNGVASFFQGLQGFQGNGGRNANSQSRGQAGADRLTIRPAMRIGFETTPRASTISSPRFATRFSDIIERRPELRGVNFVTDESGRVLLRGTVANEGARDLAAAIVRLEPGVRDVVNELEVADSTTP